MTWMGPDEEADPGGLRGRWVYLGLGCLLLAAATALAAATGGLTPGASGLVVLSAVWLAPLAWLYPRKRTHLPLVTLHYAGLLALGGALVAGSQAFTAFASLGYPLAIALFPARLRMVAVAATAIVMVVAQGGALDGSLTVVILGVAVPLLVAGWQVAAESERSEKTAGRLRRALAENAGLQERLLTQAREAGVLDERQRLAREIHDTIAQDLVALITQVRAADGVREDAARWRRHMDQVEALAARGLTEARRSVRALRPAPLEESHLPGALAEMAARWAETARVGHTFEVTGTPRALDTATEVTLFRVAQEALANIAKHAGATRAGITLSYLDDVVLLDVRDDGAGFTYPPVKEPAAGYGLETMRERVHAAGGTFTIETAPGQGTAVAAAIPTQPEQR
ncbi:signal transduction histidine kinase [Thermocatellispora tengchongensis]|uniref:Oxygen sensor histidine kinase NreB n=1 Tax=Thermocatellispora tengchongensis TaxID=1073253 RepID=A0A840P5N9_9ACTN|nr:sensor histidine kinase [Thermocatellispora tengchongensis]MBB5132537.1 signal transduction histidine kinase [Thermocatellispora tengchongensis]